MLSDPPRQATIGERLKNWFHYFAMGMGSISIWQELPKPDLGSIEDDWKTIGNEIRKQIHGDPK